MAGLQQNGLYEDAYHALQLLDIPRVHFSFSWWYRTEFELTDLTQPHVLQIEGVNYRAALWLNGKQIATPQDLGSLLCLSFGAGRCGLEYRGEFGGGTDFPSL